MMDSLCSVFRRDLRVWLVDPDLGRKRRGDRPTAREALRMGEERGVEDGATTCERGVGDREQIERLAAGIAALGEPAPR